MNKKHLQKIGIVSLSIILVLYLAFLILPLLLSPVLNGYSHQISKMVEDSSGFKIKFEKMQIVTTPKLSAGLKIAKTEAFLPNNDKFFEADNFQVKLSLLPILLKRLEFDIVSADSINLDLKVQKDGKLLVETYIPEQKSGNEKPKEPVKFFLKLSNKLPDIRVKQHRIAFIDIATGKKYVLQGNDTKVTDFILDKKVKISGTGAMDFDGRNQFNYDIKIFNKVMPDVQLDDLVFNPKPIEKKPEEFKINVIDVFKGLYNNQLTANLKADVKTFGTIDDVQTTGSVNVDKLTIAVKGKKLPDSFVALNLKGNKILLDSDVFTAEKEMTHITGKFKTGKNPDIDMTFKSNSDLKNIVRILNSVASSFGIKDLQTVTANGLIDADFNIKSNMKNLESSGYLRVANANINHGLYKVSINNINSDVSFDNNMVDIKNAGFLILGNPLKLYGTIKQDSSVDISVIANQLSLKSILLSLGQVDVLKENAFKSGTLSLNASVKGKLQKPVPVVNISIDNLNLKNIPTDSTILMASSKLKIDSYEKTFKGKQVVTGFKVINPALIISAPVITSQIFEKEIIVNPTNFTVDKIKLTASGKIKDYMSEKAYLDFVTGGDIKSTLTGNLYAKSQTVDLAYSISTFCTIPIPGFNNSKLQAKGDLRMIGSSKNPVLKGSFTVPYILIPDMAVTMTDMVVNLNGPILKGNGSLKKFRSGGVVAQNLNANFLLKGDLFYLSGITGDAFSGKVKGNIDYNVKNGKTGMDFVGSGMNATDAIYGSSGIKNALSGTLDFNTKVTLQGITYEDMVRSLKGDFVFNIVDGALGKMGRLETFLNAQNILANHVMRAALNAIQTLRVVRNTANFKYIKGSMDFSNGWADISSIKTSGPTMAYYIKGKYNILNGTTNVIILGRLSSDVVALLGPIGDLSVDKLTSYIPKFGALTAVIIKSMTSDPNNENTAEIPSLSSGDKVYKDFKVVFNGGIESQSSVKSFKWLSNVDTSAIDVKQTVTDVKKQFTDAKQQLKDTKDEALNQVKGTVDQTKQELQNTKDEIKNLFKF